MEAIQHLRSHDVIAGGQVSNERQTHRPTLKHRPRNQTLSSDRGLILPAVCWSSLCFLPNTSAYWMNMCADVFQLTGELVFTHWYSAPNISVSFTGMTT